MLTYNLLWVGKYRRHSFHLRYVNDVLVHLSEADGSAI